VEPSLKKALEGNRKLGLHTLILLDIGLKASEGLELLLKAGVIKHEDRMVAACRLGGGSEIAYGEAGELAGKKGLEKTPAVLVIPGKLHFLEEEFLRRFSAI
jgi:diphthamide biosynthesis methyltransferase